MIPRRTFLQRGSVALAAIAGCTGQNEETDPQPAASATETDTRTLTPTETVAVSKDKVVNYNKLSVPQQKAFDQARNEPVIFSSSLPESTRRDVDFGIRVSLPFREHKYVRKNGTLYELRVKGPHWIGGTRVTVEPTDDAKNGTVIQLENQTGEGYELLRRAIEANGTAEGIRVERPDSVSTGDIVKYKRKTYVITHLSIRDYAYFKMTVEKYS